MCGNTEEIIVEILLIRGLKQCHNQLQSIHDFAFINNILESISYEYFAEDNIRLHK